VPVEMKRHVVPGLKDRVFLRYPLLEGIQEVRPAHIERRRVQRANRVELAIAALLDDQAKMGRHRNAALRVDPVHRARQKPVHCLKRRLSPPDTSSSHRSRSAAPPLAMRLKSNALCLSGDPHWQPAKRTTNP